MKTRRSRPVGARRWTASGDGRSQIGRGRAAWGARVIQNGRSGFGENGRRRKGGGRRRSRRQDRAGAEHAAIRQGGMMVATARGVIVHGHGRRFGTALVGALGDSSARSRGQQTDESQNRDDETQPIRHCRIIAPGAAVVMKAGGVSSKDRLRGFRRLTYRHLGLASLPERIKPRAHRHGNFVRS